MMSKLGNLWQIGQTFGLRDGTLRLEYEAQRGTGLMARRMQSVSGWESWDLKRIAPQTSAEDFLNVRRQGGRPFFFSDARSLAPALEKALGTDGEKSLLTEANKIIEGRLPFFGRLSLDCGFPPRWFQNPVTGQSVSPNRPWTQMRFADDEYGDLKFILESSRFLFVYPLARAYVISGDERFPEAFWSAIENWAANSPPMSGPLWICGQESSLRILAWSFAFRAFLDSPETTPRRAALLLSMIAAHAWRTAQTVGYARSQRSNHLFSEAVGLWTAGTLYPELKDAATWQNQGAQLLREAVLDQITPEGAYLQNSFNYQRMVLHQLLWTLRLAEINKLELDPRIRERTASGFDFISEFVDRESGRAPNHGSNDGSNILPLTVCDYGDFRPLLSLGSRVLNRSPKLQPGPWDEAGLWFSGASAKTPERESAKLETIPEVMPATAFAAGYHRIGSRNSWALIKAANYTRRPFQADQLHVDLWWYGLNLARDAGTYLYNGEPPWNNGLAGTAVHNTVMVDRRDQMRRAGRFLWLEWAQASGRSFATTSTEAKANSPDSFEGEHDGYRRIGVKYRREVRCVSEDAWIIVDDLLGADQHELSLHWLLPDLPFEVISTSPFCAKLSAAKTRFRWNIFSSSPGSAAIIRAGKNLDTKIGSSNEEDKLFGWESPTYGELRPAISLLYNVQGLLPVRFVTLILASDNLQFQQEGRELILRRDAEQVYQVSMATPQSESVSG